MVPTLLDSDFPALLRPPTLSVAATMPQLTAEPKRDSVSPASKLAAQALLLPAMTDEAKFASTRQDELVLPHLSGVMEPPARKLADTVLEMPPPSLAQENSAVPDVLSPVPQQSTTGPGQLPGTPTARDTVLQSN